MITMYLEPSFFRVLHIVRFKISFRMSSDKPRTETISMLSGLKVNNLQSRHPVSVDDWPCIGFPIAFKLSLAWGQPWKILPVNSHSSLAHCGVNWSLEFESCRKYRLRILDMAKIFDELVLVLVIPIDLQNYPNDYTFLIPIHWFKTDVWLRRMTSSLNTLFQWHVCCSESV